MSAECERATGRRFEKLVKARAGAGLLGELRRPPVRVRVAADPLAHLSTSLCGHLCGDVLTTVSAVGRRRHVSIFSRDHGATMNARGSRRDSNDAARKPSAQLLADIVVIVLRCVSLEEDDRDEDPSSGRSSHGGVRRHDDGELGPTRLLLTVMALTTSRMVTASMSARRPASARGEGRMPPATICSKPDMARPSFVGALGRARGPARRSSRPVGRRFQALITSPARGLAHWST